MSKDFFQVQEKEKNKRLIVWVATTTQTGGKDEPRAEVAREQK